MNPSADLIDIGDEQMLGRCPDGRKIWLRGPGIPGDSVSYLPEGKGGVIDHILTPAPGRLAPPCAHFGTCPGCQLQPMPYATQLDFKARKITETLRRLGGFSDFDFRGIVPSPDAYGSRNKLDFTVEGPDLGYQSPEGLVPIHDCLLADPVLRAAIPFLRDWLRTHPDHGLHRLLLRVDADRDALHLLLRGTPPDALLLPLASLATEIPSLRSLSLQADWKSPWRCLHGDPDLHFTLADEDHTLRFDAFFQVNDRLADSLVRRTMDWLREEPCSSLLDLFCGAGAFTLPAARHVPKVLGIDSQPGQGPFLAANLHNGLPRDRRIADTRWDAVLCDPPRAGMSPALLQDILRLNPKRILYVSCNPATLARDLQRLCQDKTHTLQRVQGFDLFPQTTHVETLALLLRT
jgi:23S rRNA (uracil1939-C5)-methyltransferase